MIHELGRWDGSGPKTPGELQWTHWRPLGLRTGLNDRRPRDTEAGTAER
jgi:hypothetical protein